MTRNPPKGEMVLFLKDDAGGGGETRAEEITVFPNMLPPARQVDAAVAA